MYKRLTTVAGKTILVRFTDSSRVHTEKGRKPKSNPTPLAVQKVNRINQARKLTALLNHNFGPGDMWIVLSYPEKISPAEAEKELDRFKRNIRTQCRKQDIPFRIVETMGIGERSGKPHHHIVINQEVGRDLICRYWPEQYVHVNYLWMDGNYQKVAHYMLKNAEQTANLLGKASKGKRAWRASRTVKMPETREEILKRDLVHDPEDIKPRKGYYIDRDSIRCYEHPITGASCIEYIEISLEQEPRLRKYYKGKEKRLERLYPVSWDEQLSFDDMIRGLEE